MIKTNLIIISIIVIFIITLVGCNIEEKANEIEALYLDNISDLQEKIVILEEELLNLNDVNETLDNEISKYKIEIEEFKLLLDGERKKHIDLLKKYEELQAKETKVLDRKEVHEIVENIVLYDKFSGIYYNDDIDSIINLYGEPLSSNSYEFFLGESSEGFINEYSFHNLKVKLLNDNIYYISIQNTGGLNKTKINIGDHYSILKDIFFVESIDLSNIDGYYANNPFILETDDEGIVRVVFADNPVYLSFFVEDELIIKIVFEIKIT